MACGEQHFVAACELGLKGVSKRGDAPYRSGPARSWVKERTYFRAAWSLFCSFENAGAMSV